jgi:DNA adenine methylase
MSRWVRRAKQNKPLKPALSYYGGKQRMASKIIPLLPRHTVYVEPFAGGAAVFFRKPWPRVTSRVYYREVINDIDCDVVNFYKQLRDNGEALARAIDLTPYSKHENTVIARQETNDDIERARRYFVDTQHSFSNKRRGGWARNTLTRNSAAKENALFEHAMRMKSVYIECDDALNVIKNWDSPQTLFYCDPPYPGTAQGHYAGYTIDDFRALVSTLDSCVGSFVLSNYDQPDVEIPSDWERFEFGAYSSVCLHHRHHSQKGKRRTEVVWRRFNTEPIQPELAKVLMSGAFDEYAFPRRGRKWRTG